MRQIRYATENEHNKALEEMSKFFESDEPYVGIFWLNPETMTLFGVQKELASICQNDANYYTYPKLHKTFWQKQHNRARAKKDTSSIFYNEHDYTKIPRGRIFVSKGQFIVKVGHWLNDIDTNKFEELIIDEFNLPDDFLFDIDEHWDLGKGWSEDKIYM